jgi:hypothetical protein
VGEEALEHDGEVEEGEIPGRGAEIREGVGGGEARKKAHHDEHGDGGKGGEGGEEEGAKGEDEKPRQLDGGTQAVEA